MIPPDGLEGRRGASAYSLGICSRVAALRRPPTLTVPQSRLTDSVATEDRVCQVVCHAAAAGQRS